MKIDELLRRCRVLVATGWCTTADARDANGREIKPTDADARAWSVLGALAVATASARLADLEEAVLTLGGVIGTPSLRAWNDAPGRDQRQVVAAFDEALVAIRG